MSESLPSNSQISHYRLLSKLGADGMGEVYLALDTKLDRKVALKILPADVAANRDRMDRFIREAKSAAALNHPNIAHVYEIGESDGTHFIAMEFIDGETLREKIHLHKTPLSKLLKYLNQVAEVNQALEITQQALAEKDPMFVMLPRGWPDYSRLRTEPRFREIVSHLGLPGWSVTAG